MNTERDVELWQLSHELKRAKFELQCARAHCRDLFELAPMGYLVIGATGVVHQANLAASSLLDIEPSDLLRQSLAEFILEEDQQAFHSLLNQWFASRLPRSCELRMLSRKGASMDVRLSASAMLRADEESIVCLALSDVSATMSRRHAPAAPGKPWCRSAPSLSTTATDDCRECSTPHATGSSKPGPMT
jgi:PAS domain S-box-containing protein